eukprot:758949-Hanusia_phi.AAC.2
MRISREGRQGRTKVGEAGTKAGGRESANEEEEGEKEEEEEEGEKEEEDGRITPNSNATAQRILKEATFMPWKRFEKEKRKWRADGTRWEGEAKRSRGEEARGEERRRQVERGGEGKEGKGREGIGKGGKGKMCFDLLKRHSLKDLECHQSSRRAESLSHDEDHDP